MELTYEALLDRLYGRLEKLGIKPVKSRLEAPPPQVINMGNRTVLRNFLEYARLFRREPAELLGYLSRALATSAHLDGERAIFKGNKDAAAVQAAIAKYQREYVNCPVCGSPDTRLEKVKKVLYLVCEACGARSPRGA
ncbi:MAG: translation initiation factor IF-2 subunit beta [Nitrososphaerota archaeon]